MRARQFTDKIFIRSTVLPGTNDRLRTISMPEFLTERKAYMDMCSLPILLGKVEPAFAKEIFPNKQIFFMSNAEAELAKFVHNCFGAMKVTYFNAIAELCERLDLDFRNVKTGSSLTGYIEPMHTTVPGPDGLYGYGGKCFPENVRAIAGWLHSLEGFQQEHDFFDLIESLNHKYRGKVV
jgi:UDPglucose 6-dehydrogenase